MNREEKNLQTRQKIIDSAISEFGEKSYGEASLNTVCSAGNISKGIIYHYFKDKDELYLTCVKECFNALTGYLASIISETETPIEAALENYFEARIAFFAKNPHYFKLFCNVTITPPPHLLTALAEIKSEFTTLNLSELNKLLKNVKLCPDVTTAEVVETFREYQDFLNTRFQMQTFDKLTIKEHEKQCSRWLKILLYGVIERGTI